MTVPWPPHTDLRIPFPFPLSPSTFPHFSSRAVFPFPCSCWASCPTSNLTRVIWAKVPLAFCICRFHVGRLNQLWIKNMFFNSRKFQKATLEFAAYGALLWIHTNAVMCSSALLQPQGPLQVLRVSPALLVWASFTSPFVPSLPVLGELFVFVKEKIASKEQLSGQSNPSKAKREHKVPSLDKKTEILIFRKAAWGLPK